VNRMEGTTLKKLPAAQPRALAIPQLSGSFQFYGWSLRNRNLKGNLVVVQCTTTGKIAKEAQESEARGS